MASDGTLGPFVLWRKPPDAGTELYSPSHWRHLLAAIGCGLLVHGIGQVIHPGRLYPVSFAAGFMAGLQFWFFRSFSLRTRIAAAVWALIVMVVVTYLTHELLHRLIYPWFER